MSHRTTRHWTRDALRAIRRGMSKKRATAIFDLSLRVGPSPKMVENSLSLLVILSTTENTPIGVVTLHDVIRSQNQLSDAVSL